MSVSNLNSEGDGGASVNLGGAGKMLAPELGDQLPEEAAGQAAGKKKRKWLELLLAQLLQPNIAQATSAAPALPKTRLQQFFEQVAYAFGIKQAAPIVSPATEIAVEQAALNAAANRIFDVAMTSGAGFQASMNLSEKAQDLKGESAREIQKETGYVVAEVGEMLHQTGTEIFENMNRAKQQVDLLTQKGMLSAVIGNMSDASHATSITPMQVASAVNQAQQQHENNAPSHGTV